MSVVAVAGDLLRQRGSGRDDRPDERHIDRQAAPDGIAAHVDLDDRDSLRMNTR